MISSASSSADKSCLNCFMLIEPSDEALFVFELSSESVFVSLSTSLFEEVNEYDWVLLTVYTPSFLFDAEVVYSSSSSKSTS